MLVFKSVLVPILSYGHESWVMTKRVLSQAHEVEKRILRRLQSGTLRDRVHIAGLYFSTRYTKPFMEPTIDDAPSVHILTSPAVQQTYCSHFHKSTKFAMHVI